MLVEREGQLGGGGIERDSSLGTLGDKGEFLIETSIFQTRQIVVNELKGCKFEVILEEKKQAPNWS